MAILAVQAIRKMRGGSQAHLMWGDHKTLWVVKFQNNPQHLHVLANEHIATHLARHLKLSVPPCEIIEVPQSLIDNSPQLEFEFGHGRREQCLSGRHFASRYLGDPLRPGTVFDLLPHQLVATVGNLGEFAGILAFDKWACNIDYRQAVFTRTSSRTRTLHSNFIDQGCCFGGSDWTFPDSPLRGRHGQTAVYQKITGWESFSPWVERIEQLTIEHIYRIANCTPTEWYSGGNEAIDKLTADLYRRRLRVRDLIYDLRKEVPGAFPLWTSKSFAASLPSLSQAGAYFAR